MSEERLPGASPGDVPSAADIAREPRITDTEIYEGDLVSEGGRAPGGEVDVDPLTDLDLQPGETDDPNVAAEEGLTWVAPMDPPLAATKEADGDPTIGAGFGTDALTPDPYDESHRDGPSGPESEVTERVREALRADAETTDLADTIEIAQIGDAIVLAGEVEDLEETDAIVAVASRVTGIEQVVDRLSVRGVEEQASSADVRPRDVDLPPPSPHHRTTGGVEGG